MWIAIAFPMLSRVTQHQLVVFQAKKKMMCYPKQHLQNDECQVDTWCGLTSHSDIPSINMHGLWRPIELKNSYANVLPLLYSKLSWTLSRLVSIMSEACLNVVPGLK